MPDLTVDRKVAELFLSALGDPPYAFQTFHETEKNPKEKRSRFNARVRKGTLDEHWEELSRLNTGKEPVGVHVTINLANDDEPKRRRSEDIIAARAIVLDFDDAEKAAAMDKQLRGASMRVRTKRGIHVYWLLKELEADLERWEAVQKAMLARFGSDHQAKLRCQTLRVPGFFHRKEDPFMVELESCRPEIRWTLDEIVDRYRLEAILEQQRRKQVPRSTVRVDDHPLDERIKRCQAMLDYADPAIEGSGGWSQTSKVCGIGHDFGLTEDEYWPLLLEWNARCAPPWDHDELRAKLEAIYRNANEPFGYRLGEKSKGWEERERRRAEYDARDQREEDAWAATMAMADVEIGEGQRVNADVSEPSHAIEPDGVQEPTQTGWPDAPTYQGVHTEPRTQMIGEIEYEDWTVPDDATDGDIGIEPSAKPFQGWGPEAPRDPKHDDTPADPDGYLDETHLIEVGPDGLPMTEHGNGQRFVRMFGTKVRHVSKWGKGGMWLFWDGRRWRKDSDSDETDTDLHAAGVVLEYTKCVSRSMMSQTTLIRDDKERTKWKSHCKTTDSCKGSTNMLKSAGSMRGIGFAPSYFDRDGDMLNTWQCVLDLRHGQMLPHSRDYSMTKMTGVSPADQDCPVWRAFLHRVLGGDEEVIDFVQRAMGYSITGETSEQVMFSLWGSGRNGKTTFLNVLRDIAGEYCTNTDFSAFEEKKTDSVRNDLARLNKARIVTAVEPNENRRLDEAVIKRVTGDEPITCRFLFGEYFDYFPTFKVWLSSNHKIEIRGSDEGIWRRICMIPFTVRIPKSEVDKDLPKKLKAELPAIMHWVWLGAQKWYREGLQIPAAVQKANEDYRAEMDVIGDFLRACTVESRDEKVTGSELYGKYRDWCQDTGQRGTLSKTKFGQRLKERTDVTYKRTNKGVFLLDHRIRGPQRSDSDD
jgi:P4 family phage/plasmid primase-like protien